MDRGGSVARLAELRVERPASRAACARPRRLPGEAPVPSTFRALLLLPPPPAPIRAPPTLRVRACARSPVVRGGVPCRTTAPTRCSSVAPPAYRSSGTIPASSFASRGRSASPMLSLSHHSGPSARLQAYFGTASPPPPRLRPRRWPAPGLLGGASAERSAAAARVGRWRTSPLPPRHAA